MNISASLPGARTLLFCALGFFFTAAQAREQLDTNRLHQIAAWLPAQPAAFAWPITNRAAWGRLAASGDFTKTIAAAEKLLAKPLPEQPDALFLEFSQTGNRTHWQAVAADRRGHIGKLTLAEAFENQGRFLPALEKTITAICAERTWVMPAHDGGLGNFHGWETVPDLGATGRGEEQFRRGDHLPTGGMVLATPELVIAQLIEAFGERKVAAELQHRMFADGVVRGEKGAEFHAGHRGAPPGASRRAV